MHQDEAFHRLCERYCIMQRRFQALSLQLYRRTHQLRNTQAMTVKERHGMQDAVALLRVREIEMRQLHVRLQHQIAAGNWEVSRVRDELLALIEQDRVEHEELLMQQQQRYHTVLDERDMYRKAYETIMGLSNLPHFLPVP